MVLDRRAESVSGQHISGRSTALASGRRARSANCTECPVNTYCPQGSAEPTAWRSLRVQTRLLRESANARRDAWTQKRQRAGDVISARGSQYQCPSGSSGSSNYSDLRRSDVPELVHARTAPPIATTCPTPSAESARPVCAECT